MWQLEPLRYPWWKIILHTKSANTFRMKTQNISHRKLGSVFVSSKRRTVRGCFCSKIKKNAALTWWITLFIIETSSLLWRDTFLVYEERGAIFSNVFALFLNQVHSFSTQINIKTIWCVVRGAQCCYYMTSMHFFGSQSLYFF